MEIRVGINNSPRELSIEVTSSVDEVERIVSEALEGGKDVIRLADARGRIYLIARSALTYLEIGAEEARRVGFVA